MRYLTAIFLSLVSVMTLVTGCGGSNSTEAPTSKGFGACSFTISWPTLETNSRYIPTNAQSIEIRVWGIGSYDKTQVANRTTEAEETFTFTDLVAGLYNVSATAYSAQNGAIGGGSALSSATTTVDVRAGTTNEASLALASLIDHLTFTSSTEQNLLVLTSTLKLTKTIHDHSGNTLPFSGTITWLTGNESVATVNSSGSVVGVAAGSTNIICRLTDGAYTRDFTYPVTVNIQPPKYIAWGMDDPTALKPTPTVLADTGTLGVSNTITNCAWNNTNVHPFASTYNHPYGEWVLGLNGTAYGTSNAMTKVDPYYAAAGWVYITDTNATHKNIVSSNRNNGNGSGYAFYVNGNGGKLGLETIASRTSYLYETTVTTIPLNTWTHVAVSACALSGSPAAQFYINGMPVSGSGTVKGGYDQLNNNIVFGNYPGSTTNGYVGLIDDIQIYRKSTGMYTNTEVL